MAASPLSSFSICSILSAFAFGSFINSANSLFRTSICTFNNSIINLILSRSTSLSSIPKPNFPFASSSNSLYKSFALESLNFFISSKKAFCAFLIFSASSLLTFPFLSIAFLFSLNTFSAPFMPDLSFFNSSILTFCSLNFFSSSSLATSFSCFPWLEVPVSLESEVSARAFSSSANLSCNSL